MNLLRTTPGILVVAALLVLAGCTKPDTSKENVYDLKAKVIASDPANKKVTLDSEEIPGHMKAMKMPFDVSDAKLLDGIKAGDQVHGKLSVKNGTSVITELMKH